MKKNYEKYLNKLPLILGLGLLFLLIYLNSTTIIRYIQILKPFWIGIVIAYILNIPTTFLEEKFKYFLPKNFEKHSRTLAIVSVILSSIFIIYLLIQIVFPQLFQTISQVIQNSDQYAIAIEKLVNDILSKFNIGTTFDFRKETENFIESITQNIQVFLKSNIPNIINNTLEITASLLFTVGTFFIGFIISIYLLGSKNELINHSKALIKAITPKKYADKFFDISSKANVIFKNFISGQILDCIALGTLCYIGMVIFQFPYAILISTLVTTLAIVPYFGAFSAMFIGSLLMLPISPAKSFYFIIYFIILQQLEGNFVYPRIVGNKVGLPGVWVLVSVILFSGIFGFKGLFFAVPVTAVIYHLLKEYVHKKLEEKM